MLLPDSETLTNESGRCSLLLLDPTTVVVVVVVVAVVVVVVAVLLLAEEEVRKTDLLFSMDDDCYRQIQRYRYRCCSC